MYLSRDRTTRELINTYYLLYYMLLFILKLKLKCTVYYYNIVVDVEKNMKPDVSFVTHYHRDDDNIIIIYELSVVGRCDFRTGKKIRWSLSKIKRFKHNIIIFY